MNLTLQPVPDDEDPTIYLRILKEMWMQRLREKLPHELVESFVIVLRL
jgi:hypothetical protein